ncbi:response regulator [Parendozoicomonas haliclonae]|uniref:histidine kinase n=1 Tax=Parendozoicomonas haliclonae TaxID=1960125 RepID=A0A1X7ALB9_9GAMM|nr:response regulator [Parendozoicomonas haliclonae]SMA48736.1 Sensory/regulatory protein RpfC [Parendozoicomonas haliclonae]
MSKNKDVSQSTESKLGFGLSRTLFSWFLALSLIPLIAVGIIEYNNARKNIIENRHEELSTINLMLSRQIGDYFDDILVNLHFRSGKAVELLTSLQRLRDEKYPDVQEMTRSPEYYEIIDKQGIEFIDLMRFYDYSDVLIGDADGNIVYSVGRYSDFGENLFTGSLSDTKFAKTVRKAIDTNARLYADQHLYPPAGDEKISFFVLPLVNDREQIIGFMAAQIWAVDDIGSILNRSLDLSKHIEAYVIGQDKLVRFSPTGEHSHEGEMLDTKPVNEWLGHLTSDGQYVAEYEDEKSGANGGSHDNNQYVEQAELAQDSSSHIRVYPCVDGDIVIGVSRNLEIAGTSMLILTEMDYDKALAPAIWFRNQLILILSVTSLLVLVIAGLITRRIVNPIRTITSWVNQVASGNYVDGEVINERNEIGVLSRSFQSMTERLRKVSSDNRSRSWHQEGQAQLNNAVRGEQAMAELCRNIITTICRYMDIPMGAMYVLKDGRRLQMMGSFSLSMRKKMGSAFALGEGLPGQAALEKQSITLLVPEDYFAIESGLGSSGPDRVFVMPVIYEGEVRGVLEFALLGELEELHQEFLEAAKESIAIAINSALARERVQELLDKTTHQAETLQQQQEDLRTANEELEHQTKILKESEEELKTQSDELQRANVELEEKSESLFHQKEEIELKNEEIEKAREAIERKADELEQVSKYKSEFLANMSHELRTPLNSMLILARMLSDNEEGNLDGDQVESAQVIHKVGHDLLDLINDILDLSKVEAGKLEVNIEPVSLQDMLDQLRTQFTPIAGDKKLDFEVVAATDTQVNLETDGQRVMQIIKNLLSNAFKFTEKGGVKLRVSQQPPSPAFASDALRQHGAVCLAVEDSGIGIPRDKQDAIFSAFQQADGSTSRKYGGTGLGLSIAREMAVLLGGEMILTSEEGKGSVFSLLLPAKLSTFSSAQADAMTTVTHTAARPQTSSPEKASVCIPDDREKLEGSRPILIVEDDAEFARVLYRLATHHGCKGVVASTGADALSCSERYNPQAIILDLGLPDMDGRDILQALKQNAAAAEIPVHIISGRDNDGSLLTLGASEYLTKPVSSEKLEGLFSGFEKDNSGGVLVVDPDSETAAVVHEVLNDRREVFHASTAAEAREIIGSNHISHLILELALPDEKGDELLAALKFELGDAMPSVIINTSEEIDRERYKSLGSVSGTMVVKGENSSAQRLQDEVAMFLNSVARPASKRSKPAAMPRNGDGALKGRKILLVDDDLRNTFALSKALQKYELDIVLADNGELALKQLEDEGDVELVLMDIMMPVMDGYEAMKRIRQMERFKELPVIALTAKAMAEDRDKCIKAGASDYLTKPVDVEKLVAMLRVWLQV